MRTEHPAPSQPPAGPGAGSRQVSPTAHYWRLLSLLAVGVVMFLAARSLMVPESFGRDGHYRATAVDEIVAQETRYMGSVTCTECHQEKVAEHEGGAHQSVPCETCHGPARGHLTMGDNRVSLAVDAKPEFCLACHSRIPGRPKGFPQIHPPDHSDEMGFEIGDRCTDCHEVHSP